MRNTEVTIRYYTSRTYEHGAIPWYVRHLHSVHFGDTTSLIRSWRGKAGFSSRLPLPGYASRPRRYGTGSVRFRCLQAPLSGSIQDTDTDASTTDEIERTVDFFPLVLCHTYGLHNGLGWQSIVHTQWVPPPPPHSIVNLNVPPPMSLNHGFIYSQITAEIRICVHFV